MFPGDTGYALIITGQRTSKLPILSLNPKTKQKKVRNIGYKIYIIMES